MILKEYQKRVSDTFDKYLFNLKEEHQKFISYKKDNNIPRGYHFPKWSFIDISGKQSYSETVNKVGDPVPSICFKIPTGGGKTLQVCHAIPEIQRHYLQKNSGLVLWIVPSQQIYAQTLNALKDKNHPYRRVLDIGNGNRTFIKEKEDSITPNEIDNGLVILILMLPSANRSQNEYLKLHRDSGRYAPFFPAEDHYDKHKELLMSIPNLEVFKNELIQSQIQIKSSLGNLVRIQKPIIILDEGHKTYSTQAREKILDLNPSFILELSATPSENSNVLMSVSGKELLKEEMIKLPIHLNCNENQSWQETLEISMNKRTQLEIESEKYRKNCGIYIRPICLIQVERTGKRDNTNLIHAEDVKETLLRNGIPEEHIAIKSSSINDIEGINLLSEECQIRYIITNKALQEGWDCPFAYVLCILNNSKSATSVTQLLGRILRQPNAKRTNINPLDECYVFTNRNSTRDILKGIKHSLEKEGLGDVIQHILVGSSTSSNVKNLKDVTYRPKLKKFLGKIYLPKFIIPLKRGCRDLNYEVDILSRIPWDNINYENLSFNLDNQIFNSQEITISLSENTNEVIQTNLIDIDIIPYKIDFDYFVRRLSDVIPNPWTSFDIATIIFSKLSSEYSQIQISNNISYIIEHIIKYLQNERDRLAKEVFESMLRQEELFFFLCKYDGCALPTNIKVEKSYNSLRKHNNEPLQKSLFDKVPEDELNESEKDVALYLDNQSQLLWWYRNRSKQDYYIQGWRESKIYPDFIVANKKYADKDIIDTVFVLETKGTHLWGNEDSIYKSSVFELCNTIASKVVWSDVRRNFPNENFKFQVVKIEDYRNMLNGLFA